MESSTPLTAVVDDEAPVRKALGRLLKSSGFRVLAFDSGPAFIESLARQRPDCVVLDVHMPGMSGFETQARLLERGIRLPTIFITAFDDQDLPRRLAAAEAAGFLRKPFTEEELLRALRCALEVGDSVARASKAARARGATATHEWAEPITRWRPVRP